MRKYQALYILIVMNKKLKNPVWYSLSETHEKWLLEFNGVRFYKPEICTFGAYTDIAHTAIALNQYAEISDNFFLVSEYDKPLFDEDNIRLKRKIEGCQMVLQDLPEVNIVEEIIPLTEEYINEIYELVWLVMPGYYQKRTFEMGDYFGIFRGRKLISVAGQRMQSDKFIEISAVVTHPDYTRRGFAKQLTAHVVKEILKERKTPILHTTKGNPAIKLYEDLGFNITRDMNWWYFCKK